MDRVPELDHFIHDISGAARVVHLAVKWLSAPIAVEGTAAGGDHIHGEVPVARASRYAPILFDVDQIACRHRQDYQARARRRVEESGISPSGLEREAADALPVSMAAEQEVQQLTERALPLTADDIVRAVRKVSLEVISGIGAVNHDPASGSFPISVMANAASRILLRHILVR